MLFVRFSAMLATLALSSIPNGSNAQFVEFVGTGFCRDAQDQFYARGASEKFDSPQACLDNCLLLDDSDLVGIGYKYSNKRCHCLYNVGSEVIETCNPEVFTNGCRSNRGYTGSGFVDNTEGPSSWNCYAYEASPTFTPFAYYPPSTPNDVGEGVRILQTGAPVAVPVVVVAPVSEPTPKGTKKGSGGKNKGKRNLQTFFPVTIETVAPVSTPKGAKKGPGGKTKGKRNLQTFFPVAIETVAPMPTPKGTKKDSGDKKGKRNLQTSSPITAISIAPKGTKKGGNKKKGNRILQTSSPVTETLAPVPPKKGTKKIGGKKKQG